MTRPQEAPEAGEQDTETVPSNGDGAPIAGCLCGGCLVPIMLFFGCAVFLGDTGGPLFWPFIAVPLGLVGLAIGSLVKHSRQQSNSR